MQNIYKRHKISVLLGALFLLCVVSGCEEKTKTCKTMVRIAKMTADKEDVFRKCEYFQMMKKKEKDKAAYFKMLKEAREHKPASNGSDRDHCRSVLGSICDFCAGQCIPEVKKACKKWRSAD